MVKKYQETANFVSGVLDVTELQNISPFMSKPQKFSIQRVLVLSDADYQLFVNDDFRRPPVVIRAKQRYMGFDVKKKAWNCLLVVSEISKDGKGREGRERPDLSSRSGTCALFARGRRFRMGKPFAIVSRRQDARRQRLSADLRPCHDRRLHPKGGSARRKSAAKRQG